MWTLDSMQEFTIDSLTGYIDLIKKENLAGCYFRGESKKHENISSTLARCYNSMSIAHQISNIGNKLIEDYYREIGAEIDKNSKDNFLAFSQHHGIKTNLIDFTTAPLIALYFACKTDAYKKGYVYALKNESTVEATDLLKPFCTYSEAGFSFFKKLSETENFNKYKELIQQYLYNNFQICSPQMLLDLFIKKTCELESLYCKQFVEICKTTDNLSWKELREFIEKEEEKLGIAFTINSNMPPVIQKSAHFYCILFLKYLKDVQAQQLFGKFGLPNIITAFPPGPYLIYKVPISFDRIKRQCGVFIYQGIIDFQSSAFITENGKRSYGVALQPIIPDILIKVENQKEITKDLDMIGINEKSIFGDFDTTASYVMNCQVKCATSCRKT
jgi:hypothetical protein